MDTNVRKILIQMSKLCIYGIVMHLSIFTLVFATDTNAQTKSVENIQIKIDLNTPATLDKLFKEIELDSDFEFSHIEEEINTVSYSITLKSQDYILADLLREISSKTDLSFKRVNDNIFIRKKEKGTQPLIEVIEAKVITGQVTDENGEPLPGATVFIKGSSEGTVTDVDGQFRLEVEEGSILVVSFVGFETREIAIDYRETYMINLQSDIAALDEIVVVGYGVEKKENLTGAVNSIQSSEFENNLAPNTSQILQGVSPNLNITLDNGGIDEEADINIRGIGSINGGQPLVLIDGVEGNINRLNPRDIKSISVLKDAASSSIYGARAAFGVILITTKDAEAGKLSINYTNNFGLSSPTIDTDNFITDGLEWARLSDKLSLLENTSTYLGYSEEDYAYLEERRNNPSLPSVLIKDVNGAERYVHYGSTDWWNVIFNNSQKSMEHNLSMTGGSEKMNFYLSGRYYTREGIYNINKDVLEAFTLRSKVEAKPYDWLTIGNSTNVYSKGYSQPATNTRRVNGSDNSEDWRKYTYHAAPMYLPRNPDGSFIIQGAYTNNRDIADGTFADIMNGKSRAEDTDFETFNTSRIDVRLMEGLNIKGNYTFRNRLQQENVRIIATPFTNQPNGQGVALYKPNTETYKELQRTTLYQAINAYADYTVSFSENHSLNTLVGFNQEWNSFKRNIASRNGNLSQNLNSFNLATGDNVFLTSTEEEWAIRAGFYRLKYNFSDRYLIEFNGRFDWSSRFPTDARFGFFPSASAAWRVSEETFWSSIASIVNEFKIRGSYGSLGNQNIGPYDYISTLSINQSNYIANGGRINYLTTPSPVSSNFTWETSTTTDIGLDMGFLDDRLQASFDWYQRDVVDMLTQGRELPSVFGASEPEENAADLRTRGFEATLDWRDRIAIGSKSLNYRIGVYLADSRTHITKFDNPNGDIQQYYEGQELGEIWGYTVQGFFQDDNEYLTHADQTLVNERIRNNYLINHPVSGDIKFADLDGDGRITPGDLTLDNPGDLKRIGNTTPRYSYGINLGADYMGFDVSVFAQGIMQRDWLPGTDNGFFWGPYTRQYQNFYPKSIESLAWSETNRDAYFPRLAVYAERGGPYEGAQLGVNSDKYLQNAAYLRVKNITVGYTLPSGLTNNLKIASLRVYATGINLFTFSPLYENNPDRTIDPEQLGNGNDYPFTKTYAVGLDIKF